MTYYSYGGVVLPEIPSGATGLIYYVYYNGVGEYYCLNPSGWKAVGREENELRPNYNTQEYKLTGDTWEDNGYRNASTVFVGIKLENIIWSSKDIFYTDDTVAFAGSERQIPEEAESVAGITVKFLSESVPPSGFVDVDVQVEGTEDCNKETSCVITGTITKPTMIDKISDSKYRIYVCSAETAESITVKAASSMNGSITATATIPIVLDSGGEDVNNNDLKVLGWDATEQFVEEVKSFVAESGGKAVLFTEQTLTEEQKAQVRENIGVRDSLTDAEKSEIVNAVIEAMPDTGDGYLSVSSIDELPEDAEDGTLAIVEG